MWKYFLIENLRRILLQLWVLGQLRHFEFRMHFSAKSSHATNADLALLTKAQIRKFQPKDIHPFMHLQKLSILEPAH